MNAGDVGSKFRLLKRAAKDIGMGRDKFTPRLECSHDFTVHGMQSGIFYLPRAAQERTKSFSFMLSLQQRALFLLSDRSLY